MAGAGSEINGEGGGLTPSLRAKRSNPYLNAGIDGLLRRFAPRNDAGGGYFPAPPLLSKNTPCSPNIFQTHQGRFSGTGRP
jgi:hypothetical protein